MTTTPAPAPSALSSLPELPALAEQAERLLALGVTRAAGLSDDDVRARATMLAERVADAHPGAAALLVVHPRLAPPSGTAALLRRHDRKGEPRSGFVVEDMTDVDAFAPVDGLEVPDAPLYAVVGLDRGDDLANWSPEEAKPELATRGRTPLTLPEGIWWAVQLPDALDRNRCYMTIGSRLRRPDGRFDARTPAVWISNGTGRDGRERRDAPKVGWCWWGNRHTWLGFASATARIG
ncbi:DUF5701 family protein [Antribacter sp. KLBMP9083]|uniref:DUF5701 family protein n=1 Tax=Antribacter soli TaxID=2910976 RepID=A0AA41QEF5_9MICO|nr:DUF5701 family protein [Antribacter soli]MCF4121954.1 DUF5701 family protein [Antribacter soli]